MAPLKVAKRDEGFWKRLAKALGCVPVYVPAGADRFDPLTEEKPGSMARATSGKAPNRKGSVKKAQHDPRISEPQLRIPDTGPPSSNKNRILPRHSQPASVIHASAAGNEPYRRATAASTAASGAPSEPGVPAVYRRDLPLLNPSASGPATVGRNTSMRPEDTTSTGPQTDDDDTAPRAPVGSGPASWGGGPVGPGAASWGGGPGTSSLSRHGSADCGRRTPPPGVRRPEPQLPPAAGHVQPGLQVTSVGVMAAGGASYANKRRRGGAEGEQPLELPAEALQAGPVHVVSGYYPSDMEEQYVSDSSHGFAHLQSQAAALAAANSSARGLQEPSGGSFVMPGQRSRRISGGLGSRPLSGSVGGGESGGGGGGVRDYMNAALARMRINNSLPRGQRLPVHLHVQVNAAGDSGTATTPDGSSLGGLSPVMRQAAVVSPSGGSQLWHHQRNSPSSQRQACLHQTSSPQLDTSALGPGSHSGPLTQLEPQACGPTRAAGAAAAAAGGCIIISPRGSELDLVRRQHSLAAASTASGRLEPGARPLALPRTVSGSPALGIPLMSSAMLASRKLAGAAQRSSLNTSLSEKLPPAPAGRVGSITSMGSCEVYPVALSPR